MIDFDYLHDGWSVSILSVEGIQLVQKIVRQVNQDVADWEEVPMAHFGDCLLANPTARSIEEPEEEMEPDSDGD